MRNWLATDSGNPCGLAMQALVHGQTGELVAARCILAKLEQTAGELYVSPAALAIASAGCGRFDDVFRWLEKGVDEHDLVTVTVGIRALLPGFESDPRCHALLRKMNLAPEHIIATGR
jgi:hypothetical protein